MLLSISTPVIQFRSFLRKLQSIFLTKKHLICLVLAVSCWNSKSTSLYFKCFCAWDVQCHGICAMTRQHCTASLMQISILFLDVPATIVPSWHRLHSNMANTLQSDYSGAESLVLPWWFCRAGRHCPQRPQLWVVSKRRPANPTVQRILLRTLKPSTYQELDISKWYATLKYHLIIVHAWSHWGQNCIYTSWRARLQWTWICSGSFDWPEVRRNKNV